MTETRTSTPTLAELAQAIHGTVVGDDTTIVAQLVHPRMISKPTDLALIIDPDAVQLLHLHQETVQAAVVAEGIPIPEGLLKGYITVQRPRVALAVLLNIFNTPPHHYPGIHPTALVDESAQVHPTASVGPFCTVGPHAAIDEGSVLISHVSVGAEAKIGKKSLIYPGVRLGDRVLVGNRVTIHHNASIGADGFSYVTPEKGSIESARESGGKIEATNAEIVKINSIGTVILEDDVEVGACATIDRANLGATHIKKGTKIDNLVMIGHNNTVGENCLIVSQVGVSGSCKIGDRVVLAGQVGLKDHITIGDDAIVMAKAGVMDNIAPKAIVVGQPARPQREVFQQVALIGKLSEMRKDLMALKKRLAELETELEKTEEATPV